MKKLAAVLVCIAVIVCGVLAFLIAKDKKQKSENKTTTVTTEESLSVYDKSSTVSVLTNSTVTEPTTESTSESESKSESESESKTESETETTTEKTSDSTKTTTEKLTIRTSSTTSTTKTTTRTTTTHKKVTSPTYINGILIANKTYALPADYNPGVNPAAQKAADEMIAAAKQDGISLWIRSGFRSYSYQANLYNNYVARDGKSKADTYSARPGHSEHQTGLAFDMNSLSTSFANTPEGRWLAANCWKYGFIIRYPKGKEHITGYQYEPWHVRYLGKDTAQSVYNSGLTLEEYLGITSKYSD